MYSNIPFEKIIVTFVWKLPLCMEAVMMYVSSFTQTKQHFEREIKHGQLLRQLKDNLLQNRERLYMEAEVLHKDIVANKTTY